ncbi:unnamed protein product [Soboliphyme baturini]|uniref:FACT complex subunit SSRP1 n=1 Tax=Soboliphyme baturini TaxID=241478 RepID=A0A183IQB5_9BILA|nr:unnamed protein product [Soboliphyme baturini]
MMCRWSGWGIWFNPGRMKLSDQSVAFKNIKTGKVDQFAANNIESCEWIRLANRPAIKMRLKNDGLEMNFQDFEKLKTFVKQNWRKELDVREPCVKGWNYGTAKFVGSMLEFEVDDESCFDIPLAHVSNCTATKNEVTLEFHQNDDCAVSLLELRFHIPTDNAIDDDKAEQFRKNVMEEAGIIQETGKALAHFDQILCATPRGRYDVKIYPSFLSLHGKTFDYKIPIATILRLLLLPHQDGRRMFFVVRNIFLLSS